MKRALDICLEYGVDWNIKFNPGKTEAMVLGKQSKTNLYLQNGLRNVDNCIKVKTSIKYLGYWLSRSLCESVQIKKRTEAIAMSHLKIKKLNLDNEYLNAKAKAVTFLTLCRSVFLYGTEVMVQ